MMTNFSGKLTAFLIFCSKTNRINYSMLLRLLRNLSIKYKSKYYNVLRESLGDTLYKKFHDQIRSRIILTLNDTLYKIDYKKNSSSFFNVSENLKAYENGTATILRNIYTNQVYAFIPDGYPSFVCEYGKAVENNDNKLAQKLFLNHATKIYNKEDHKELNSLAWGVYTKKYDQPATSGIKLIKRALKLDNKYAYLDTYAALLFASGQFEEAKFIAQKAIDLAEEKDIDYSETTSLLENINNELNR